MISAVLSHKKIVEYLGILVSHPFLSRRESYLLCTVGLDCYAGWNFCTYVPYASNGLLDRPDQNDHFDIPMALSNCLVVALEGLEVLAI